MREEPTATMNEVSAQYVGVAARVTVIVAARRRPDRCAGDQQKHGNAQDTTESSTHDPFPLLRAFSTVSVMRPGRGKADVRKLNGSDRLSSSEVSSSAVRKRRLTARFERKEIQGDRDGVEDDAPQMVPSHERAIAVSAEAAISSLTGSRSKARRPSCPGHGTEREWR